jgi:uncharacterized protein YndB with AHSA1/START domain
MPAHTTRRFFSRETRVSVDIAATADRVWSFLTDASGIPRWNSTVVSLTGEIKPGGRIALVSTLDPKRTFKLAVKGFEPGRRLVWGDAMGTRTYEITPRAGSGVTVTMHEKIGGPFFPLFARMIPSFDAAFDQFAADLKRAVEASPAK